MSNQTFLAYHSLFLHSYWLTLSYIVPFYNKQTTHVELTFTCLYGLIFVHHKKTHIRLSHRRQLQHMLIGVKWQCGINDLLQKLSKSLKHNQETTPKNGKQTHVLVGLTNNIFFWIHPCSRVLQRHI